MTAAVACVYCEGEHAPRYICDELAAFLAELRRSAEGNNLPTIELDEPLMRSADALLMTSVVVEAVVFPVLGVPRPGIIVRPSTPQGPTPALAYIGTDDELDQLKRLIVETIGMARVRARAARGGRA